jgi:hypothetical protein
MVLSLLSCLVGCDGFVGARIKVVSPPGEPIGDALIRRDGAKRHDLAHFTDLEGCADFGGVVAPSASVPVTIAKAGFQTQRLALPTMKDSCLVVHLAPNDSQSRGFIERIPMGACACAPKTGYRPTLMARFKVKATEGPPLEMVALEKANEERNPWSRVTDKDGCIGVSWIVAADIRTVPLVLERVGYQPASIAVATMDDGCYAASMSPVGSPSPSKVERVLGDGCECRMFSGVQTWPKR